MTKVGVGVAILKWIDNTQHVLLGERKSSHGEGELAFPGGHLEHLESFKATAIREIREEVGIDFGYEDLTVVSVTNLIDYAPKHYVDIGMVADYCYGEPKVMEPDKVISWNWVPVDEVLDTNFKYPLFATVRIVLSAAVGYSGNRTDVAWVYDSQ